MDINDYKIMDKVNIAHLEEILLDVNGNLNIVPYEHLKDFTQDQISQFCVEYGFYCLPTFELISFLKEEIGDKFESTIEIGAGHGAISRTLGIRAVDNFMQEATQVKALYEAMKQTPVQYGEHVERIDANSAVKKYSPSIVVGAYCTHLYNAKEHFRGGNAFGIDEKKIIRKVDKYIHIGNEKVHNKKPILKEKHRTIKEKWILSRSQHANQNVIWIWEK